MAKGFTWAGDLNGHKNPIIRKYPVADATAIEAGEPIIYTNGTGVGVIVEPIDFDDPINGVSLTEKAQNDGTVEIEVSRSHTALYKYRCKKVYTLTGGSTTTAVDSSLRPQTDNFWKGGAIRIVTCAGNSALVGKIVKISASTGADGTLTLAETLPTALASGDTIQLCPGEYAHEFLGYDLTADSMDIDFDADGGNVLRIISTNPDLMEMTVLFERHADVS